MSDLLGFYSATELGLGHVVLEPLDIIRLFLGLASSCRFWDLLCQNFWTSVRLCVCALTVVHLCSVEFVVMMNVFSLLADSRSVSVHRVNMSLLQAPLLFRAFGRTFRRTFFAHLICPFNLPI